MPPGSLSEKAALCTSLSFETLVSRPGESQLPRPCRIQGGPQMLGQRYRTRFTLYRFPGMVVLLCGACAEPFEPVDA